LQRDGDPDPNEPADGPRQTGVIVLGAGWAGLAAAVELTAAGHPPLVIEAAPHPGGRAKGLSIPLAGTRRELDNGQHLLIGAYRQWLKLASTVGARQQQDFERMPMHLLGATGLSLRSARLPAPWHLLGALLGARGLPWRERWAVAALMMRLRLSGWQVPAGETVETLLERLGQPATLRSRLWHPLVLATMNTHPSAACAQTFANVLRDSLGGEANAADFILPSRTLSQVFPEHAARWLQNHGASLLCGVTVRSLQQTQGQWQVQTSAGRWLADQVVIALPAHASARLIAPLSGAHPGLAEVATALARFEYDSIATIYLAWPAGSISQLPRCLMLDEGPDTPGQWLFDRGVHGQERIAAVVVSLGSHVEEFESDKLAAQVAQQLVAQLNLPVPLDARAVIDRRATFRCTPDRPKIRADALASPYGPGSNPMLERLTLAGDYVYPDYPATLESAVRSGIAAAARVLASN